MPGRGLADPLSGQAMSELNLAAEGQQRVAERSAPPPPPRRTTLMPRSSEALSSSTRVRQSSGPNSWRTMASALVVLPVPGGP